MLSYVWCIVVLSIKVLFNPLLFSIVNSVETSQRTVRKEGKGTENQWCQKMLSSA